MFSIQGEELRIDHLTLLLVVTMPYACRFLVVGILYWGLQVTYSFSIRGCVLKGCFERGIIFWRTKSHLRGIEDFNLEHWPLGPSFLSDITQDGGSYLLRYGCPDFLPNTLISHKTLVPATSLVVFHESITFILSQTRGGWKLIIYASEMPLDLIRF